MTGSTTTYTTTPFGYTFLKVTKPRLRRFVQLFIGEIVVSLSIALGIKAKLGISPWAVFHQGLSLQTGISFGTILVGIGVLLIFSFRYTNQPLGLGTIGAALVIGPCVDLLLRLIPEPTNLATRSLAMGVSPILFGLGVGLYLGTKLGPGPRDSLMTALVQKGMTVSAARTGIELTVLLIGWALAGNVGIGTLWHALSVGWVIRLFLPKLTVT